MVRGEGGSQQWCPTKVVCSLRIGLQQGSIAGCPLKCGRGGGKTVPRHPPWVGQVQAQFAWGAADRNTVDLREVETLLWSDLSEKKVDI